MFQGRQHKLCVFRVLWNDCRDELICPVFWSARLPDWGYFELIYVTVGIRIGGLFCQSPKVRRTDGRTERAQQGVEHNGGHKRGEDGGERERKKREPLGRAALIICPRQLSCRQVIFINKKKK